MFRFIMLFVFVQINIICVIVVKMENVLREIQNKIKTQNETLELLLLQQHHHKEE